MAAQKQAWPPQEASPQEVFYQMSAIWHCDRQLALVGFLSSCLHISRIATCRVELKCVMRLDTCHSTNFKNFLHADIQLPLWLIAFACRRWPLMVAEDGLWTPAVFG